MATTSTQKPIKLTIIGDTKSGKTSLLQRMKKEGFAERHITTIGVDFRMFDRDNLPEKTQVWDTAGNDRFKTITSAYVKGVDAVIIMIDPESEKDLTTQIKNHHNYLSRHKAKTDMPIFICVKCPDEYSASEDEETLLKAQKVNGIFFTDSKKDEYTPLDGEKVEGMPNLLTSITKIVCSAKQEAEQKQLKNPRTIRGPVILAPRFRASDYCQSSAAFFAKHKKETAGGVFSSTLAGILTGVLASIPPGWIVLATAGGLAIGAAIVKGISWLCEKAVEYIKAYQTDKAAIMEAGGKPQALTVTKEAAEPTVTDDIATGEQPLRRCRDGLSLEALQAADEEGPALQRCDSKFTLSAQRR